VQSKVTLALPAKCGAFFLIFDDDDINSASAIAGVGVAVSRRKELQDARRSSGASHCTASRFGS
jgi:hypothetical protein